jgi:photosystem II stability/assembly factor-like uncharacterized protein
MTKTLLILITLIFVHQFSADAQSLNPLQTGWQLQKFGDVDYQWLCFNDSSTGWAISDSIYSTTDGGQSWLPFSKLDYYITCFWKITNTHWIAGQGIEWYYETTNSGLTWTSIHVPLPIGGHPSQVNSLTFQGQNVGWMLLGKYIKKTLDGGKNWSIVDSGAFASLGYGVIRFSSPTRGFAFGNAGKLRYTQDGGITWQTKYIVTNNSFFSASFTDSLHGIAVAEQGTIVRTTDGGDTWTLYTWPFQVSLRSVFFVGSNLGWIVGGSGLILRTTDGGATWTKQESNTTNYLHDVYFLDSTKGWIIGEHGTILSTTSGGVTTSIRENVHHPFEFTVEQNYPNPFNPATRLRYSIPHYGRLNLSIYDILGNQIAVLHNGQHNPGQYEKTFVADKLSSGIYLYRAIYYHDDEVTVAHGRMLFLK